jgi:hypothetical protein
MCEGELAERKGYGSTGRWTDGREERRTRAWERQTCGMESKKIAEALGVTEGAGCQWRTLKAHPAPGARLCLTAEQLAPSQPCGRKECQRMVDVAERSATAATGRGDQTSVWGAFSPGSWGYLVRTMGDRMQQPVTRATQRNEKAIEHGKAHISSNGIRHSDSGSGDLYEKYPRS